MAVPKKKRRKRWSDRWFEFCERVAFRLVDEQDVPPDQHGLSLLLAAFSRWLGRIFFPQKLADALQRRSADQPADDRRRFTGVVDFLEYLVGSFFHQIGKVGSWVYKLLVPEKLIKETERVVVEKSVDTYRDVTSWTEGFGKLLVPAGLRKRLRESSGPVATGYTFLAAWYKSRPWKNLLWAIPLIVFTVPMVAALAMSLTYSDSQKEAHYLRALNEAVDNGDEAAQAVYLQKLAQLGYRQMSRAEFRAAWELSKEEAKWDEAVAKMQSLAPLEEPGYAQAHLWLAQELLDGNIEADEVDRWLQIEKHAQHALELSKGHSEQTRNQARLLLARVMDRRGEYSKAAQELNELSDDMPSLHFGLMQRALAERDANAARRHARKVVSICESLSVDPRTNGAPQSLTAAHCRAWTLATKIVDGVDASQKIAQQSLQWFPDDEFLRVYLANLLARGLAQADMTSPASIELLRDVFRLDPKNSVAFVTVREAALEDPAAARQLASKLAETDSLSAALSLSLGDQRWSKNDAPGALWFYTLASKVDASSVAAWNNVAWLCGNIEETLDLDLALRAVNQAIQLDEDPRCYETRGQIYARLERWPEAISDLERALNGSLPDTTPAHATLAKALAAVGDHEAAEAHRRKAEQGN